ncbi:MAG: 4Fe-4S dicluster domain-containing protein [Desulfobacterales bacterium]|jgi:molybdopterin-containing oxidoreductase family iron-sulfur binding subunit
MAKYGIIVDLDRCTGCMTCVIACKQENLTPPGVWWNKILELESETLDRITFVRHACMHCENPPCVTACSHAAIFQRPDGIVLIEREKCEEAGDCADACPYGAIHINPAADYFPDQKLPFENGAESHRRHPPGTADTCTLCVHRIDAGQEPICVTGCPSKAMIFGDYDDPDSLINKELGKSIPLLAAEGTHPKVRYLCSENLLKEIETRIRKNPKMERS